MSNARAEEIIKKGFLKSLLNGTLEIKDLAGINIDLPLARQAYLQGVQEATQTLIELIENTMATASKQDLQATAEKQDLLKNVVETVQTAVEALQEHDEELHEYDPTVFYEDDFSMWAEWAGTAGSYGITISEEFDNKISGVSSVKMVIGAGDKRDVGIQKDYGAGNSISLSAYTHISILVWGTDTDLEMRYVIYDVDTSKTIRWGWIDNWIGWKRVTIAINDPEAMSSGFDISTCRIFRYHYRLIDRYFTSYVDRMVFDTMKPRLEGTIEKLIEQKEILDTLATASGQAAILDAINEEAYVEESDTNLYAETRDDVVISTTYIATILKVRILIAGTYRVEWEMKQNADLVRGYFKVYKNGVAHGSQQQGASPFDEWSQVSEDLYFIAGDVLCVYGKEIDGNQIYCKNLQLDGTISEGVAYQE